MVVLFEDRADGVRHDICAEKSRRVGMCLEDYTCCCVVGERRGIGAAEDAEAGGWNCSSSSCGGMQVRLMSIYIHIYTLYIHGSIVYQFTYI